MARHAGLNVVMNRCMKVEHTRYFSTGNTSHLPDKDEPFDDV
jgi:hypothetical protein